jgi:hypothetical protein
MKNQFWAGLGSQAILVKKKFGADHEQLLRLMFSLVYGHLNGIFLIGNFTWVFARPFANSGQKDFAKF